MLIEGVLIQNGKRRKDIRENLTRRSLLEEVFAFLLSESFCSSICRQFSEHKAASKSSSRLSVAHSMRTWWRGRGAITREIRYLKAAILFVGSFLLTMKFSFWYTHKSFLLRQ